MIDNLNNVFNYIEENLSEEITLDQLSKVSYYSKTYLSKLFNHIVGISLTEYINKRRISNAAIMLYETDHSIQYISDMSGFKSPKYFSTLFKKEIGVSPSLYRKEKGFIYVFPKRIIKGGKNKVITDLKDAIYEIDIETKDMEQFEITIEKEGNELLENEFKTSINQVNSDQASLKFKIKK